MKKFTILFTIFLLTNAIWFTIMPVADQLTEDMIMADEIAQQLRQPLRQYRTRIINRVEKTEEEGKEPSKQETKLNLKIHFTPNSSTIEAKSYNQLSEIAKALNSDVLKSARILIEGHTDSVGDAYSNQRLSEQRAVSVRDHLVDYLGINVSRFNTMGKGENEPIANNNTAQGRIQNRRVTLINQGE